jgi:hypothetical protein
MLYYYSTKEGSRREQAPRNTCSLLTATIKPSAEVGPWCRRCCLAHCMLLVLQCYLLPPVVEVAVTLQLCAL